MNNVKLVLINAIPLIFVILGLVVVAIIVNVINDETTENQTYTRFVACALSVQVEERDQARIEECWDNVQEDTGVEVKRYDQ